jgi:hypothetical protein
MFRSIGEFQWYPSRGSEGDDVTGIVVGRGTDPAYARSFLDAARYLAAEVARPTPSAYHAVAIPTLYCFRHALELMLKALLREVDSVVSVPRTRERASAAAIRRRTSRHTFTVGT